MFTVRTVVQAITKIVIEMKNDDYNWVSIVKNKGQMLWAVVYVYIAKLLGYSNQNFNEFILIDQEVSFILLIGYNKISYITNYFCSFLTSHHRVLVYIIGFNNVE